MKTQFGHFKLMKSVLGREPKSKNTIQRIKNAYVGLTKTYKHFFLRNFYQNKNSKLLQVSIFKNLFKLYI